MSCKCITCENDADIGVPLNLTAQKTDAADNTTIDIITWMCRECAKSSITSLAKKVRKSEAILLTIFVIGALIILYVGKIWIEAFLYIPNSRPSMVWALGIFGIISVLGAIGKQIYGGALMIHEASDAISFSKNGTIRNVDISAAAESVSRRILDSIDYRTENAFDIFAAIKKTYPKQMFVIKQIDEFNDDYLVLPKVQSDSLKTKTFIEFYHNTVIYYLSLVRLKRLKTLNHKLLEFSAKLNNAQKKSLIKWICEDHPIKAEVLISSFKDTPEAKFIATNNRIVHFDDSDNSIIEINLNELKNNGCSFEVVEDGSEQGVYVLLSGERKIVRKTSHMPSAKVANGLAQISHKTKNDEWLNQG